MKNRPEDQMAVDRRMNHSRGVAQLHYERRANDRLKESVARLNWKNFNGADVRNKSLGDLEVANEMYTVCRRLLNNSGGKRRCAFFFKFT
jgi:hypothetical protein